MRFLRAYTVIFLLINLSVWLAACGGSGTTPTPISSFELLDPTPGAGDKFGRRVVILSNGNIIVSDVNAVHLYNPITQTIIDSFISDNTLNDRHTVTLGNNNFVIASLSEDAGGIVDSGSVILVNGATGVQIGNTITGDTANDQLGSGGITTLVNNNFVIASPYDDAGGIVDSGAVILVDGATGVQIGSAIEGDSESDRLGFRGIFALANSNFVVASHAESYGGKIFNGTVRLVNGATGMQIGDTIAGDESHEILGSAGITTLPNSNFVTSALRVISGIGIPGGFYLSRGSVRLVNGTTGAQISGTLEGDTHQDYLGSGGIFALANNNFIIASPVDDEDGVVDAGSVRLVNGTTGVQIGNTIAGDTMNDQLGLRGILTLANNNFVIASPVDDESGIVDAGSVRLVNGATGVQIGSATVGDAHQDNLGSGGITELPNNNFIIASPVDDEGGIVDAGSVRLVNGATGVQIGNTLAGDAANAQLGSGGTAALVNNNFVITSQYEDVGGTVDAGSVRLVDGATGVQIGNTLAGDTVNDQLGSGGITALANNNFIIASPVDDEDGVVDAGSVRLVDGTTGVQIGSTIAGIVAHDMNNATVTGSSNGDNYILSLRDADNNGLADSGFVHLFAR